MKRDRTAPTDREIAQAALTGAFTAAFSHAIAQEAARPTQAEVDRYFAELEASDPEAQAAKAAAKARADHEAALQAWGPAIAQVNAEARAKDSRVQVPRR